MRASAIVSGWIVLVCIVQIGRSDVTCSDGEYLNSANTCSCCPSFASCKDSKIDPKDDLLPYYEAVDDSWTEEIDGNRRIKTCPVGFIKIYDENRPPLDDCFMCPKDTYVLNSTTVAQATEANKFCQDCVVGATCPGASAVKANEGFWRNEKAEAEGGMAVVIPCQPEVCIGNNTCREGHHGEVCGKCLPGWVLANAGLCQNCESNGGMNKNTVKALVITAATLASMALWYLFALRPLINPFLGNNRRFINKIKAFVKKISSLKSQGQEGIDDAKDKKAKVLVTVNMIAKLQGIFKVVLSSFQISTSFLTIFTVDWPEAFSVTMGALWFTRLDILALPGIACIVSDVTWTSMFALKTMGPVLIAFALFIPSSYVLIMGWHHLTHEPIKSLQDQIEDLKLTPDQIEQKEHERKKKEAEEEKARREQERLARQESLRRRREEEKNNKPALPPKPTHSKDVGAEDKKKTTYFDVYLSTLDRFWYALVLLFYIVFPMCSSTALASFFCIDVGEGAKMLGHDPRWTCPRDDKDGLAFLISVVATMMWPIGLPFLLLLVLEMYNVPALSADTRNSAALKAFLDNIGVPNTLSLGSSFMENLCRAFGKSPSEKYSALAYLKAYSILKDHADHRQECRDRAAKNPGDGENQDGNGSDSSSDEEVHEDPAKKEEKKAMTVEEKKEKKQKEREERRAKRREQKKLGRKGFREKERSAGAKQKDQHFLASFFAKILLKAYNKAIMKDYFESWPRKNEVVEDEGEGTGNPQEATNSNLTTYKGADLLYERLAVGMATEMEKIRHQVLQTKQKRAYVNSQMRRARKKKKKELSETRDILDDELYRLQKLNVLDEKNINGRDIHRFFDAYLKLCKPAQARLVNILASAKRYFLPGYEPDEEEGGAKPEDQEGDATEDATNAIQDKLGIDSSAAPMLDDDVTAAFDLLQDESFVACGQIDAPPDKVKDKKEAAAWGSPLSLLYQVLVWSNCLWCCPQWLRKPEEAEPGHDAEPMPEQDLFVVLNPKPRPTTVHHMLLAFVNTLIEKEKVGVPVIAWRQADDKHPSTANLVRRSGPADRETKFNVFKGKADFVFLGDDEFQMTKTKAHGRAGFLYETYEVEFWYFEVVEMFRKLLMTSLPLFLFPGKPLQIVCTIIISTVFLVVFMRLKPYLDPQLDFLQSTTLLAQSATLFYGLLTTMADEMPNIGIETVKSAKITGWMITLANIFVAIAPLLLPLFTYIKSIIDPEQDDPVEVSEEKCKVVWPKGACKLTVLTGLIEADAKSADKAAGERKEREDAERREWEAVRRKHAQGPLFSSQPGSPLTALGSGSPFATALHSGSPIAAAPSDGAPNMVIGALSPTIGAEDAAARMDDEAAGSGILGTDRRSVGRARSLRRSSSSNSGTSSRGPELAPTVAPTFNSSDAPLLRTKTQDAVLTADLGTVSGPPSIRSVKWASGGLNTTEDDKVPSNPLQLGVDGASVNSNAVEEAKLEGALKKTSPRQVEMELQGMSDMAVVENKQDVSPQNERVLPTTNMAVVENKHDVSPQNERVLPTTNMAVVENKQDVSPQNERVLPTTVNAETTNRVEEATLFDLQATDSDDKDNDSDDHDGEHSSAMF